MKSAEYEAATRGAALFDRSGRGKLAVAGDDRRSYLHAMLTNDIAALQPGSGCYAAYLTPQGRMMADMRVLELGDVILLDLDPAVAQPVLQKLDQFVFSEDVKLGDLTDPFGELTVVGPQAAGVVAAVVGGANRDTVTRSALEAWPEFRNVRASFRGEVVVLAAASEMGLPGFDLYIERPAVQALAAALTAAGAVAAGSGTAEVLRVEAGRPAFGVDMDTETIPLEAGIEDRAISFTKGCYPGQEVIIRVIHRGHGRVARKLAGLVIGGDTVPARGDLVHAGDREAGRVTSAVRSPKVGAPIALALLHRDFLEPGTDLTIGHDDARLAARVTALPF